GYALAHGRRVARVGDALPEAASKERRPPQVGGGSAVPDPGRREIADGNAGAPQAPLPFRLVAVEGQRDIEGPDPLDRPAPDRQVAPVDLVHVALSGPVVLLTLPDPRLLLADPRWRGLE